MVRLRHRQRNLGEVFFAREAESLMEAWMKEANEMLEDEQLLDLVYEQLGQRCPQSRKRGRNATPAEVVLRLMVLKPVRNWSYEVLEREVKANRVDRMFTRIGTETVRHLSRNLCPRDWRGGFAQLRFRRREAFRGALPRTPAFNALVPSRWGSLSKDRRGMQRSIPPWILDRLRPLSRRSGCLPAWPYPPLSSC
jgi:hypothetical protein